MEMGIWDETWERWHKEGLPGWVTNLRQLEDYLGLDRSWNLNWLPINDGIHPRFEPEVLQENETELILRDGTGVTLRQFKHGGSMPQWLGFPVEDVGDYDELLPRLNGADSSRYPEGFDQELRWRKDRGEIIGVSFEGFFGFPRNLMGVEGWCTAFYDQPELIKRIIDDRVRFGKALYARLLATGALDYVQMWEDMAYKAGPLISPKHVRKFMQPAYEELVSFFRKAGVPLIMVDSDGRVQEILPVFLDAGVDGIVPCEIAAGSDPIVLRRSHPGVRLIGGMDKRAIAAGRDGVRSELRRIQPLVREGGYVPSLDHFVPPDVSWGTYQYYVEMRREMLSGSQPID